MDSSLNSSTGQITYKPGQSPLAGIQSNYANLEGNYSNAINSQPTVPQLTQKYNDQFGVPQLQGQIQGYQAQGDRLQGQIDNASRTVGQASQQSIMTQGQRDAAVQSLTAPLQQQLGTLNTNISRAQTNLGTAQTNAGNLITAETAQQAKQLLPFTQQFSDEQVISAMQNSNFTADNANELSALIQSSQNGVALTNAQAERANQLAIAEEGFANNLAVQNSKNNAPQLISKTDVGVYSNGKATTGSAWH